MRKRSILWTAMSLFLLSCSSDEESSLDPTTLGRDLQVAANAGLMKTAIEVFAFHNGGETPADVDSDTNDNGDTLIDLLPDGERFENPYTGDRTEPRNGLGGDPGEIGYVAEPWGGVQVMYEIHAWGSEGELATFGNLEELEDRVITQAYLVRDAAEAFAAENGGLFPDNVGTHQSTMGNTLIDLLPLGQMLQNPFHLAATTPVDGAAATPGEVGYQPVQAEAETVGYFITAYGLTAEVLEIEPN